MHGALAPPTKYVILTPNTDEVTRAAGMRRESIAWLSWTRIKTCVVWQSRISLIARI
jgi:hypothetical protein